MLCVCHDLFGVPQEETPDRKGFRAFWLRYVDFAVGSRDLNQKMRVSVHGLGVEGFLIQKQKCKDSGDLGTQNPSVI